MAGSDGEEDPVRDIDEDDELEEGEDEEDDDFFADDDDEVERDAQPVSEADGEGGTLP
jgi:hypothetical protein